MGLREKCLAALRREDDAYVPFEFCLCPSLLDEFEKRTGTRKVDEYYSFPVLGCSAPYIGPKNKFLPYYPDLTDIRLDEAWGVGYKSGSVAHFSHMQHPMRNFETLAEFQSYPYPDPLTEFDWLQTKKRFAEIKQGDKLAVACMEMTIFEIAWYLRGMETFMVDMLLNPDLAHYHLDRISAINREKAKQYALAGCDILRLGDDVSTQLAMMMKLETWQEFIKPRLAAVIASAKSVNPNLLVFYHGDGNCQEIFPELIEIGVDILNPVQPECMDPVKVKKQYGDKLSFWGTLGTQTTMPFGTPDDVKQVCKTMIREVGKSGGLVLSPTHLLEPEVPWANIEAFLEVVTRHNSRN